MKMRNRRNFLGIAGRAFYGVSLFWNAGLFLPATGCGARIETPPEEPEPDIVLTPDNKKNLVTLTSPGILKMFENAVQVPGKTLSVDVGGTPAKLWFQRFGENLLPVFGIAGQTAYLAIGAKKFLPAFRWEDLNGRLIKDIRDREANFGLTDLGFKDLVGVAKALRAPAKNSAVDLDQVFDWGVMLIAAGIAVWLGSKIAAGLLSALAFLALLALLIGIVLVGFAKLGPALESLGIDTSRFNLEAIADFLKDLDIGGLASGLFERAREFAEKFRE